MAARRFFCGLILVTALFSSTCVTAQPPRLLLQTVPLAGFAYHAGESLWPQMHEGDALTLIRDAKNAADPLAVQIAWQGKVIGYLPKVENGPVAQALERGMPLSARIAKLRQHRNPRERVSVEVFTELSVTK